MVHQTTAAATPTNAAAIREALLPLPSRAGIHLFNLEGNHLWSTLANDHSVPGECLRDVLEAAISYAFQCPSPDIAHITQLGYEHYEALFHVGPLTGIVVTSPGIHLIHPLLSQGPLSPAKQLRALREASFLNGGSAA